MSNNKISTVQQDSSEKNTCHAIPLIGDKAPSFVAETTQGTLHFPQDYQGKWVILFSHPADFTPVCTTEFIYFAQMMDELKKMNTELIGLSVDSLSSHIAWLYTIQEQVQFHGFKNLEIKFPLIADLTTDVAQKYGMLHPNASHTKTVRAVFFIDPQQIIRTILYYPSSLGRNFDEIKRILIALQVADEYGIATPANWRPGDDVIVSSPSTLSEAQAAAENNESDVWFLSFQTLPEGDVISVMDGSNQKRKENEKTQRQNNKSHSKKSKSSKK